MATLAKECVKIAVIAPPVSLKPTASAPESKEAAAEREYAALKEFRGKSFAMAKKKTSKWNKF